MYYNLLKDQFTYGPLQTTDAYIREVVLFMKNANNWKPKAPVSQVHRNYAGMIILQNLHSYLQNTASISKGHRTEGGTGREY